MWQYNFLNTVTTQDVWKDIVFILGNYLIGQVGEPVGTSSRNDSNIYATIDDTVENDPQNK